MLSMLSMVFGVHWGPFWGSLGLIDGSGGSVAMGETLRIFRGHLVQRSRSIQIGTAAKVIVAARVDS